MHFWRILFEWKFSFIVLTYIAIENVSTQSVTFVQPLSCSSGSSTVAPKFYDTITLTCKDCSSTNVQKTSNGLSCQCKNGYRLTRDFGDPATITCEQCPDGETNSVDGWSCVTCVNSTYDATTRTCTACKSDSQATTERELTGSQIIVNSKDSRTCTNCVAGTFPSPYGGRCIACNQILGMLNYDSPTVPQTDCTCTVNAIETGGICFPNTVELPNSVASLYEVSTTGNPPSETVQSAYFTTNIIAVYGLCTTTFNNITACQTLSNMCVLLLYNQRRYGQLTDACAMHRYLELNTKTVKVPSFIDWSQTLPWLLYSSEAASRALVATTLSTTFGRSSQLNFRLATFTLNGTFLGIGNATNGQLQLCKQSMSEMNAAYAFGTEYSQTCNINVDDLFDQENYPLTFYDPYIQFTDVTNSVQLLPVPVRILNLIDRLGQTPNVNSDSTNWILGRRLFLVDNVGAIRPGQTVPEFVRYASSIQITIRPQASSTGVINKDGLIYTPYFTINYDTIQKSDLNTGKSVSVSFSVTYDSTITRFDYDMSVAMGVMCALAFCYATIRTWAWTRRAGVVSFDGLTILKLIAFLCSAVANAFILVTASTALYYLLFYKNQSVFAVFLPTASMNSYFIIYISVGLVLKIIDILHIFISQCTVDIFFIDWERGKVKASKNGENGNKTEEDSSIWRTYFCANEWNEIQTYRKCNRTFQVMCMLFFLEVLGFIRIASSDTSSNLYIIAGQYQAPDNLAFRYALIVAVYVIVALVQWAFNLLIYEKLFEDKLRNYVDLCSVANISVFVMAHKQFGYYIHGQSVHGTADVGLRAMYDQLNKEKENLCAKRGLDVDSEQQTFMMALPTDMRNNFDRLYAPFADGRNTEKGLDTYKALNKFLSQFISRSDVNAMKFRIVNRRLFEDILDCEFDDSTIEGHFYNDDGNSFGNILFYGHELSLSTFDLFVFCVVDIISGSVVLDAVIVWLIGELVDYTRESLSRKNLARKTLVDSRFLI